MVEDLSRYTVIVRSDHLNICCFVMTKDLKHWQLQVRWVECLSRYNFIIERIEGKANPVDGR